MKKAGNTFANAMNSIININYNRPENFYPSKFETKRGAYKIQFAVPTLKLQRNFFIFISKSI